MSVDMSNSGPSSDGEFVYLRQPPSARENSSNSSPTWDDDTRGLILSDIKLTNDELRSIAVSVHDSCVVDDLVYGRRVVQAVMERVKKVVIKEMGCSSGFLNDSSNRLEVEMRMANYGTYITNRFIINLDDISVSKINRPEDVVADACKAAAFNMFRNYSKTGSPKLGDRVEPTTAPRRTVAPSRVVDHNVRGATVHFE